MQSVDELADAILRTEGGFVNDPDDPGGATKYGITIETMRRLGLDLTGDGRVDVSDVSRLTLPQAKRILVDHYFHGPRVSALPERLHATVFDMQVNAGAQAIRLVQRLVSAMGFPAQVDGVVGPLTISAAMAADSAAPEHIADAYGIERRNYYYRIADNRPASRKYARRRDGRKGGWIVRAEAMIAPRFHLSDAEHSARTARWV